jgi:ligand-binding sensor domain-containing protein
LQEAERMAHYPLFLKKRVNMQIKKSVFPVLVLCLLAGIAHADIYDLTYLPLEQIDALSGQTINCIIQDSRGFMWFGSNDGLHRYDGYTITTFEHDPEDSTTLSHNKINKIWFFRQIYGY